MQKLNIKPGDLIEWVYKNDHVLVHKDEILWSTIEEKYVPIGSSLIHMCVSCDDETYSWLNKRGLFSVRCDDGWQRPQYGRYQGAFPRIRQ